MPALQSYCAGVITLVVLSFCIVLVLVAYNILRMQVYRDGPFCI